MAAALATSLFPEIIDLVEAAVSQAPALITEFKTLFASGAPTPADFATLRAKVMVESFFVIPTTPTVVPPPAPTPELAPVPAQLPGITANPTSP